MVSKTILIQDTCNIFQLYQPFADVDELEAKRQYYLAGGLAYGEMKQCLFERLDQTFAEARKTL